MPVWYLLASLFLVVTNGQLYENIQPEFFGSPSYDQLTGMKEYFLYLTTDQVQNLQSKGMVVRPYLPVDNPLLQHQYPENLHDNRDTIDQYVPSNQTPQPDNGLDNIYKALYTQKANEPFSQLSKSIDNSNDNPRPKEKSRLKTRQQDNTELNISKENNMTEIQPTNYNIRYFPNFDDEEFKIQPYHPQPLPGYYYFKDTKGNSQIPSYISNGDGNIASFKSPEHDKTSNLANIKKSQETRLPVPVQTPPEGYGYINIDVPLENQGKERTKEIVGIPQGIHFKKPFNIQSFVPFQRNLFQRPKDIQRNLQVPNHALVIGSLPNQQATSTVVHSSTERTRPAILNYTVVHPFKDNKYDRNEDSLQIKKTVTKNQKHFPLVSLSRPLYISPDAVVQTQYSTLLAPLLQHKEISENMSEQKELSNNGRDIRSKQQQTTDVVKDDDELMYSEFEKLRENSGNEAILTEKLVVQNVSKKPGLKRRRPVGKGRGSGRLKVITPRPRFVSGATSGLESDSLGTSSTKPDSGATATPKSVIRGTSIPIPVYMTTPAPVPVEVLQPEQPLEQPALSDEDTTILIPKPKNAKIKVNTAYVPTNIKTEAPSALDQPEDLVILRPLWEH